MKHLPYWLVDTIKCVLIVLIGLAVLWLLFSVGSLFGPDGDEWDKNYKIDWDYGTIALVDGEDGEKDATYVSGFEGLYTRDVIKCTGCDLVVSFPGGVSLDVHYFDADDNYIGSTTLVGSDRHLYLKDGTENELPEGAVGFRLCLIPDSGMTFELIKNSGLGSAFQKWKYSGYVELDITSMPASGVKVPSGV